MAIATTTQSMPDMPRIQAYRQPVETVIAALKTNPVRGLTTSEAQTRLARYGKNVLPAAPPTPAWQRFLAQFQNPLTTLLLIATVISCIAWVIEDEGGLPYEALAILAIVILNRPTASACAGWSSTCRCSRGWRRSTSCVSCARSKTMARSRR